MTIPTATDLHDQAHQVADLHSEALRATQEAAGALHATLAPPEPPGGAEGGPECIG